MKRNERKPPKPVALVTRFAYLGAQRTPGPSRQGHVGGSETTYMLRFSGHRSDFPTSEEAHMLLTIHTDQPPEKWDPDWWPVNLLKAYNHFRTVAISDIRGTPTPGLPGGEQI